MGSQTSFLCGVPFLLLLQLVLGYLVNAPNCSCFFLSNGDGISEIAWDVESETDSTVNLQESYGNKFTVKLELGNIIDERIKAYMDANDVFGKTKKDGKTKLEKVPNDKLCFQQSEQRFFRRSVPENVDNSSMESHNPEKVNDERSELKRITEQFENIHKEYIYLSDGIRNNISLLESEKQYLEGEISKFIERILAEERALNQLENRVEEIFEIFCIYIFKTEKRIKVDIPSPFREDIWKKCSKKFGFQKEFMPITYKELEDFNASCPGQDSCAVTRYSESLVQYNCQCGPLCATMDNCCFDSLYRELPPIDGLSQSCQKVYGEYDLAAFMVDKCPTNGTAGDGWKRLCALGDENDLMTYVPVTSTRTNLTYKNFYCFACHETTDDYYYWDVVVISRNEIVTFDDGSPLIEFNSNEEKWVGQNVKKLEFESVQILISKSAEIQHLVTNCRQGVVVSECNDSWLDDITKIKCDAYTAMITVYPNRVYRNPHCAVCNFESMKDAYCYYGFPPAGFIPPPPPPPPPDLSNKSQTDYTMFFATASTRMCPENSTWNRFKKICTILTCQEGYTLKNGTCVPS